MTPELARRIAFTLGALLIYRLGTYIPLPGIDRSFDHSFGRLSIFSLNILPYLSAAIIIQLVSMVSSKLRMLARSGESGRRRIALCTFGLTLVLATLQAYGVASNLQRVTNLVIDPGGFFVFSAVATLLGGTIFLVWLSEQITLRGIGNGLALMLSAAIVAVLPQNLASVAELSRQGVLSGNALLLHAIFSVALIASIVFVERARRRMPVEFAARKLGNRLLAGRSSYLPLKLNSAGLMPTVAAQWLVFLPLAFAAVVFGSHSPALTAAFSQFEPGRPGHIILASAAIFILAFIYTSFVVDPDYAADSLGKYGGVIPGIEAGEATAAHIDRVVSYTTLIGAAYLAAVFLIPEALVAYGQMPHYFGGGSALIVVCTILDIETQVRGQALTGPGGVSS
jgi:preprotein translocase subunit SecY